MTSSGSTRGVRSGMTVSEEDQQFLDETFDLILRALEENEDVRPARILQGRAHLAEQIDSLIDLARAVAVDPAPPPVPQRIDGYDIHSLIGRGGMGMVYLAHQQRAGGRPVALKILPQALATALSRERFELEAMTVAKLSHPNIIRVHDVIRTHDVFAFAMEFVDGASLQRVIDAVASSRRDPCQAVRELLSWQAGAGHGDDYPRLVAAWGAQVADALHTVHASGLLHRDVKPSNILIRRDGVALLGDFGLVQEFAGRTITMTLGFAGTAAYAPPEQLRGGFHDLDVRADVYALGSTLFHALTLRRPFHGATAVQVLHEIEAGAPPRLRSKASGSTEVPVDLELIVRKAMAPDASHRYLSAAELAADLHRFLDQRPVQARPASIGYQLAKHLRRNRRTVVVSMLAAMLALGTASAVSVRMFLFPRWSEQALKRARVLSQTPGGTGELISGRSSHDLLFSQVFWEEVPIPVRRLPLDRLDEWARQQHLDALQRLRQARDLYERAIFFGDAEEHARAERAAIDYVLAPSPASFHQQGLPGVLDNYSAYLESIQPTSRVNEVHSRTPDTPHMDAGVMQRASSGELRQLALAAYLLGDSVTATDAWVALEQRGEDDSFTSGMLGILYLINEQPVLAYPRLRTAMVAFPDTPAFTLFTADAAAQVGDRSKARQYLHAARRMDGCDGAAAFRIECLCRLDEGDVESVLEDVRVARCTKSGMFSQVIAYQLCRRLQAAPPLTDAHPQVRSEVLELATLGASCGRPAKRAMRLFVEVGAPWWLSLDDSARIDVARRYFQPERTIAPLEGGCDWRCNFLFAVADAYEMGLLPDDPWRELVGRFRNVEASFAAPGQSESAALQAERIRLTLPEEQVGALASWIVTGKGRPPGDRGVPSKADQAAGGR